MEIERVPSSYCIRCDYKKKCGISINIEKEYPLMCDNCISFKDDCWKCSRFANFYEKYRDRF